jgi:hypothetical protein
MMPMTHSHGHEADDEAITSFFEADDEASDDEGVFDDIVGGVGRLLNPLTPFTPIISAITGGTGVQNARINTPRGAASMRLPEPVVTERAFKEAMTRLDGSINKLRVQLNSDRAALQATARRQDAMIQATRKAMKKIQRQRQQDQWIGMLTTMMSQQAANQALVQHTHVAGGAVDPDSLPANNSMFLMMLPMMMGDGFGGGQSGDSGGGGMMMMMLMMVMMQQSKG